MSFKIGDRVRRRWLRAGMEKLGYKPVGTVGTVVDTRRLSDQYPYAVKWDGNDHVWPNGEPVNNREIELVNANREPGEIVGDGPVPTAETESYSHPVAAALGRGYKLGDSQMEDALNHRVGSPRSETIYPDSVLADGYPVRIVDATQGWEGPTVVVGGGILREHEFEDLQRTPVVNGVPGVPLSESEYRKMLPVGTVATEYFPLARQGEAAVAWVGNEKHNPGEPLHWAQGKSNDHIDCLHRHLIDMKNGDGWDTVELPDGRVFQVRHASAAAWRASAIAQLDAQNVGGQVVRRLK